MKDALHTAMMLVDVSYPKWRILFCNGQFDKATGLSGSEVSGQHVWDHFTVHGKNEVFIVLVHVTKPCTKLHVWDHCTVHGKMEVFTVFGYCTPNA